MISPQQSILSNFLIKDTKKLGIFKLLGLLSRAKSIACVLISSVGSYVIAPERLDREMRMLKYYVSNICCNITLTPLPFMNR